MSFSYSTKLLLIRFHTSIQYSTFLIRAALLFPLDVLYIEGAISAKVPTKKMLLPNYDWMNCSYNFSYVDRPAQYAFRFLGSSLTFRNLSLMYFSSILSTFLISDGNKTINSRNNLAIFRDYFWRTHRQFS